LLHVKSWCQRICHYSLQFNANTWSNEIRRHGSPCARTCFFRTNEWQRKAKHKGRLRSSEIGQNDDEIIYCIIWVRSGFLRYGTIIGDRYAAQWLFEWKALIRFKTPTAHIPDTPRQQNTERTISRIGSSWASKRMSTFQLGELDKFKREKAKTIYHWLAIHTFLTTLFMRHDNQMKNWLRSINCVWSYLVWGVGWNTCHHWQPKIVLIWSCGSVLLWWNERI